MNWSEFSEAVAAEVAPVLIGALYCEMNTLDHNIERLEEDHANAQALATQLATNERIGIEPAKLDTNIVVFELTDKAPDARTLVDSSRSAGVLINAISDRKIRALTHLDVNHAQCIRAAEVILKAIG